MGFEEKDENNNKFETIISRLVIIIAVCVVAIKLIMIFFFN